MTLNEAKNLLLKNDIAFKMHEFQNETEFYRHITLFPASGGMRPEKVIALIIQSPNGQKHLELQFRAAGDDFHFEELHFGDYCFEMFHYNEEMLEGDLINNIREIMQGQQTVITANDLKRERWLSDSIFDLSDDDKLLGRPGFERALRRIDRPKGWLARLLKMQTQYEIYSWNSYRRVVK